MLKRCLWLSALIAGWLMITACSSAHNTTPRYVPPAERTPLTADHPWPKNSFLVLGYHDVEDGAADQRYLSVRTSALSDQMAWLRDNGYNPISVQQILDAHDGKIVLPEKAVLLTFDDGYSSFYTRVWPLLKAYNWPALWAPVGSWVDAPANKKVDFGGLMTARDKFATWKMVEEMGKSPLVEIGAHTWASHFGGDANPQGSKEPAVANRLYDKKTGTYETDEQYTRRINTDISLITNKIKSVTGKSPRAWVWPYGAASGTTLNLTKEHGYKMAFTLNEGLANAAFLDDIPRVLISDNPSLKRFASQVAQVREPQTMRVMHVDLDYVYDKDPAQQKRNIDKLIQRVYDMRISHVFLQAYADPKGDGNIRELYFPNRWLPMRADLFNYISWQLQTRAGVTVYAWMPVLAFDLDASIPRVTAWDPKTGRTAINHENYVRLSPWSGEARQRITEIYEDLAKHASFKGILFHDDAFLTDFEDASPEALAAYRAAGLPGSIEQIRSNPQTFERWTRLKSKMLIDFTKQLTQSVRNIRGPQVQTARNIYAMPVLEPESEAWFAQNLNDFLNTYDWTAPMAMPYMEQIPANDANAWLDRLVNAVAQTPGALDKTVFELQARDWRKSGDEAEISGKQIAEWMRQLKLSGAGNYGYYPDDFISDKPEMSEIRSTFSSYWYPQK
ncbi:poly-beta-1,6-N-acetyl-D-glucosamine N-deacetylase PgaB [Citrobacter freundii]|uniref:poly-beta-1,6-N-acetyl-D-glucosamine N-deacetylase PgaB n=1 Tax=Citrobacter TaxID=544 RepID=UPI00164FC83E|nr:poly-beta-1,6-N-acetyl-D-glucosamine N-deacetylase PgaB [Citrobacter sp. Cu096]MBC6501029.1 poly-beta-1,6-N-acetyl-D-glucosamine N-deacetylase PgaB [Citrobacter freundii]MBC6505895.1 poly-beta-1,6-N-acetyl-D-glucosamine N-deacetylase PgaB [Citrobacter freundii]MBC6556547.1 poly-beta-1,6-N-acetyl-D-glucosamine N-deacetylase PgaB [Citrobacter braakii]MDM2741117.1 poly-beta-1,6-N-acetyl-D-glucosamine N-deacetylase PgaB [Citrobacter sp. Cu096]